MSLRIRLLLAAGAAALIALAIADVVTYSALRSSLYQRIDQDLQAALSTPTGGGPGGPGLADPVGGGGAFVATRSASGTITIRSSGSEPGGRSYTPALPADLRAPSFQPGHQQVRDFTTHATASDGPMFRVGVTAGPEGSVQIVALPLGGTMATLRQLVYIELAVTGGALIVALAIGWWLVWAGLRPLARMEAAAEAIASGALDARVPGDERATEVGRLARALNLMLSRIQRAFAERDATEASLRSSEERLRRFVADASHELRTPLSAVSAYAELFALGASDRPEDLARVMRGIRGETSRMSRLVEDLLLLARLDEGRPPERRAVEVVSLVAEAVRSAAVVGPAWPVRVEAGAPVEVLGDREQLRQVVDNLLANVRAHTPEGTPTVVHIGASPSPGPAGGSAQAIIDVADDGPGLSPDDAAHVFDRFFRTDVSRSRATGGTGLGLSIVAAIVDAHGGRVEATRSEPSGGATFRVRLPLLEGSSAQVPPADE